MKRIAVLTALCVLLPGCWETGRGEKIGTITRLNNRGVFCKTWEGEIIRGGLNSGSGVMGSAFHFTIENEALVPLVEAAMNSQQEVRIKFRSEGATFCRSDSDDYFLTAIEPLNAVSSPPKQVEPPRPTSAADLNAAVAGLLQIIQKQTELVDELAREMHRK